MPTSATVVNHANGALPDAALKERFVAAAGNLPPKLQRIIEVRLTEYARPARRFRRPSLSTPRWRTRLREREARQPIYPPIS